MMVVLIVLIAVIGSVLKRPRHRGRQWGEPEQVENAQLRDEVKQLKERIHVLERVITDNRSSVDLDREIEQLRDR
ncbi:hypothetical protein CKY28_02470 [Sphingomonas lenta]|uniref:Phage shock protein B n=1 Tax=Sphingomonas lenta TaxID=1141887 RepID=A0A2A2SL95_9SPHN|nr:hypothetical protein CKY28_02470 [Sphingomonas lenta]